MTLSVGSMVGAVLGGRYRLDAELGTGGMGAVYRGRDLQLDRDVAVKLVPADERRDAERQERLVQEARAAAALHHPRIASVYDVGVDGRQPFVVMELVHGHDLRSWTAPSIEDAITLALQLCDALDHAHRRGVVHRDLKPENVLLTREDGAIEVKLVDLGLALVPQSTRLTREGTLLGTPAYLAPEQALGIPVDGRADLYSLGAMLYELLTGRPPFVGDDVLGVVSQHIHAPVVPIRTFRADVPADLERVVLRLLAKSPEQRFSTAADLAEALRTIDRTTPPPAEPAAGAAAVLEQLVRGRLVGRRPELEELRALWRRSQDGACHVALVSGEPGAGKTRLARELVVQAQLEGAVVLRGGCYEYEATTPYLPIVEALRRWVRSEPEATLREHAGPLAAELVKLAPELGTRLGAIAPSAPLAPGEERLRLFDHIARLLRGLAAQRGLLLFVDDLHWADQGTLSMLHYAVRQLGGERVLVLATYREVELGRDHPLASALVDWNRERLATRVALGRLSPQDTDALLGTLLSQDSVSPEFGAAVFHETEGNPFFVEEVVKALIDQGQIYREGGEWNRKHIDELTIPQSVKAAIGHRLTRLSEPCLDVLRGAAALGKEFSFRELAASSSANEDTLLDALDEAVSAQLVAAQDADTFVFTHDKIREVLYEEMNPVRRRRLHQRVGEGLERIHAASVELHAQDLAHHFVHSGDLERGLRYSMIAARNAERVFAYDESIEFYVRARECGEGLERRDELERVEEALGNVHANRGDSLAAAEHLGRALELATDADHRATLKARIGECYARVGERRGLAYLEQALAELDPQRHPIERATAIMAAGRYHHLAGDHPRAVETLLEALAIAEAAGDAPLQAQVTSYLAGAHQHLAEFDDGDHWARRTMAIGEAHDDPGAVASGLEFLAEHANNRGNFREAGTFARQEIEIARRIHALDREAWAGFSLLLSQYGLGELEAARQTAEGVLSFCDRIGEHRLHQFVETTLSTTLADRGEWEDCERHLAHVFETAERARMLFLRCETRRTRAYVALLRGRDEEVARCATEIDELLVGHDARIPPIRIAWIAAEAQLRLGDTTAAGIRLEAGLAAARTAHMRAEALALLRVEGQRRATLGDRAGAESALRESVEGYLALGCRAAQGRTHAVRSRLRLGWGDPDGAEADATEADRLFTETGAEGLRQAYLLAR